MSTSICRLMLNFPTGIVIDNEIKATMKLWNTVLPRLAHLEELILHYFWSTRLFVLAEKDLFDSGISSSYFPPMQNLRRLTVTALCMESPILQECPNLTHIVFVRYTSLDGPITYCLPMD